MNFENQLDSLVPLLGRLNLDPEADVMLDMMSGGLVWEDEQLFEGLSVEQMGCLRAIFYFRTSLILGKHDQSIEQLWKKLRLRCPQWIGFAPSRCEPSADLIRLYERLKNQ